MQKLIKFILLDIEIENLKIRLRDNNCCKSANKLLSAQLEEIKILLVCRIQF
jgi:hypothetical protein